MFGEDVTIIGVAAKADLPEVQDFVSSRGVGDFDHVLDDSLDVWSAFSVANQPAVAFVNDDGTVRVHNGSIGLEGLIEGIQELVAS